MSSVKLLLIFQYGFLPLELQNKQQENTEMIREIILSLLNFKGLQAIELLELLRKEIATNLYSEKC